MTDQSAYFVRRYRQGDIDDAVSLAMSFHAESCYSHVKLSLAKVDAHLRAALDDPDRICFVLVERSSGDCVGYLMAMVFEYYFSHEKTASDLGFFIEKEHRNAAGASELLAAVEDWVFHVKQCRDFTLGISAGIADAAIELFYRRNGYTRGFSGMIKSR